MHSMPNFSAHTDQRWYACYSLVITLFLAAASALFMWFWLGIPGPVFLVGGVGILCGVTVFLITIRQPSAKLHFYGSCLQLFLPTGEVMTLDNLPAKAFIFQQNPLERKLQTGRLKIKGAYLTLYGVSDYQSLRQYVRDHFAA